MGIWKATLALDRNRNGRRLLQALQPVSRPPGITPRGGLDRIVQQVNPGALEAMALAQIETDCVD
jgi:hypothetical protein